MHESFNENLKRKRPNGSENWRSILTVERIGTARAREILGLSQRSVQYLAARGKLPGAAMIGSRWTFDEVKLRAWVNDKEMATCQGQLRATPEKANPRKGQGSRSTGIRTFGSVETYGTAVSGLMGVKPLTAYERAIGRRR
jgi:hypothetical protein